MLRQTGAFARARSEVDERVMDSGDLEREKGITILAKNTAVLLRPGAQGEMTINIIDTPGHADFGGEVERGLSMVDGVVLLVDASEGPLPQTRFVLRKALSRQLPVDPGRQQGRPPGRPHRRVVDEDLRAVPRPADDRRRTQTRLPDRLRLAPGRAGLADAADGTLPDGEDLEPLFRPSWRRPGPDLRPRAPAPGPRHQPRRLPFLGRLALLPRPPGRPRARARQVAWCRRDGQHRARQDHRAAVTEALERVPAESAGPGEIVAVAGIPGHHHRRDARRPRRPAAAAADHGRRAGHLDDHRHQHLAPGRPRRATSSPPAWSRTGSTRSWSATCRSACCPPSARTPGRSRAAASWQLAILVETDAPRGLRADRRQAAGAHPDDRRRAARAARAPDDRRARGVPRRRHPAARPAQGPDGADGQPRHRLGPDGVPRPGPRADRLPHRLPDRDPRHRHRCTTSSTATSRGSARSDAAPTARWSPTARRRPRRTPCSTCRSAARCSWSPARRSTRA